MIKPLNQLNAIFDEILKRRLSGSEQLILLHLYNAFNRSHWTESIELSDESLLALLNQFDSNGKPASIETIRRAKQKLKNKRLIDFEPGKGSQVTTYKLVKLYPADTPDYTPDNTPADTPEDTLIKFTPKLSEQEDVKTIRPKISSSSGASAKNFKISDVVRNCWIQNAQVNPFGETETDLNEWEEKYGTEAVVAAIRISKKIGTGGISTDFVQGRLEKIMEGKLKYSFEDNDLLQSKINYEFVKEQKGEIKSNGKSGSSNGKQNAWDY